MDKCKRECFISLNPFGVREVSKHTANAFKAKLSVLIPLESGKFLNVDGIALKDAYLVLIPLESGKFLNRDSLQIESICSVLIPLESGKFLN